MFGHPDVDKTLPPLNAALNALNQDGRLQPNAALKEFNIGLIASPFGVFHGIFDLDGIFGGREWNPNLVTGLNGPHEGVIGGPPVTPSDTPLKNLLFFARLSGRKLQPPNWNDIQIPPIKKCYKEHSKTAQRSPGEVDAYREANRILVGGQDVPKPLLDITEVALPVDLMELINDLYSSLSPLEAQCWPVALSGRDLLATVKDKSDGKTLGYLLPAVAHIRNQEPVKHGDGPVVLALTATRKSAEDIEQVACDLAKRTNLRVICLASGIPKGPQYEQLKKGAEICVATPGRLIAFMEDRYMNLLRCSYLVVDGADRIVAMGMEKQLRTIVENIRPDRQMLIWISSSSMDMERLAKEMLIDHVTVTFITPNACQGVEQVVLVVEDNVKENALLDLFRHILCEDDDQVIVFVETRQTVDYLVQTMRDHNWPSIGNHKGMGHAKRSWALQEFRLRNVSILVTTDVAAHGLNADGVRFVVNYDRPATVDDYFQRVAHGARADGTGRAYTFLTPTDSCHAKLMVSILRETKQQIPREVFHIAKRKPQLWKSRPYDRSQ